MEKFSFKIVSDVGNKRHVNEDSVWPGMNIKAHPFAGNEHGLLFIVADGMGGHGAGDIASKLAIDTAQRAYYDPQFEQPSPGDRLERAIQMAHREITLKSNTEATERMGTTMVAAVVKDSQLWCAWVGDSRLYLLRDGKLQQLTQDHAELWEEYRSGQISWEAIHYHPRRSKLTNSITARRKNLEVSHLTPVPLQPGDRLLLCSDGLSSEVKDSEIEKILARNVLDKAATKLIKAAKSPKKWAKADGQKVPSDGGEDNITAVLIEVPGGKFTPYPGTIAKIGIIAALLILLAAVVVGAMNIFGTPNTASSNGQQSSVSGGGIFPKISLGNRQPTDTPFPVTASNTSAELPATATLDPAEQTPGAVEPTSTLAPTPTSPSTPTPIPTNTQERPLLVPTATSVPVNDAPQIVIFGPADQTYNTTQLVTFEWKWKDDCEFPPEGYAFKIVNDKNEEFMGELQLRPNDCDTVSHHWTFVKTISPPGQYQWKIIVAAKDDNTKILADASESWHFGVALPKSPTTKPKPNPKPNPKPTSTKEP